MIYLIGGAPRVGKSILSKKLLLEMHIPYVSADILIHMIKKAAPQTGVTDKIDFKQKSKMFYPFLEQFVKLARYDSNNYTIEGDAFLPQELELLRQKFEFKAVFLWTSKITLKEITDNIGDNDWILSKTKEEQQKIPDYIIEKSKIIKDECQKFNYPNFDMSLGFDSQLQKAYHTLLDQH
jgi:hypothetical protein